MAKSFEKYVVSDCAAINSPFRPRGIGLLLRMKMRGLANHVLQTFRETRLKIVSAVAAVCLIWGGLYALFHTIFKIVREDTLQGIVAIPLMLDFFFVTLMVMLMFSNGIISYGSLFALGEPAYLLTRPISPKSVALLKYIESLFFASWSLILVGLPLMVALAQASGAYLPWFYYPLFGVFFLCFIPIPGAAGLVLAWAVGYWFSKMARRMFYLAIVVVGLGASLWLWNMWNLDQTDSKVWLKEFFDRAALLQGTFWPSRWVSTGLNYARDGALADAMFYLLLTLSNAVFLSWLAVRIVGRRLSVAYDRVQTAGRTDTYDSRPTRTIALILFWYLPDDIREVALKDLRTFLRDPTQWSQLLILLALLGLYVLNIPNIPPRMNAFEFQLLISFLNTGAISLILATFTSRFVFPLISLEAQQLWLMGLVPIPRGRLLLPKLIFALTITLSVGGAVMLLANLASGAGKNLIAVNMISIAAVCAGLCGMAVGLGARFPMIHERNSAKIANGVGGTINLIGSVCMVTGMLIINGLIGLRFKSMGAVVLDRQTLLLLAALVSIGTLACLIPMYVGRRHFSRMEC